MKTKIITLALTIVFTGLSALPVQAEDIAATAYHTHYFDDEVYVRTEQNGSYTHSYITGYNPNTGQNTYGTCTVMCETEYYTWRCTEPGCYATNGSFSVPVESHGSCPQ